MALNFDKEDENSKNVYSFYNTPTEVNDNLGYRLNNWGDYNLFNNLLLTYISEMGGAIWLNNIGNLCYRLNPNGDVLLATATKISIVFSNFFKRNIQIRQNPKEPPKKGVYTKEYYSNQILISYIPFVYSDKFNPFEKEEFYKSNDFIYRNTFKPTNYFLPSKIIKIEKSIILQYIYYLSNYATDRFIYIMNWLASFFKDLSNKSNITLILIGEKDSGKDILFNEIIKPLFGTQYCIEINDSNLQYKNLSLIAKEKLFYNFTNISKTTIENIRIHDFIKNLLGNDTLFIENRHRDMIEEIQIYGQTLITINEPCLPYIDSSCDNYTVFKIKSNIQDMYIPKWHIGDHKDSKKDSLIEAIKQDLVNFSMILKSYKTSVFHARQPFDYDDKSSIIKNTKDKIKAFSDAVINSKIDYFKTIKDTNSTLYDELKIDFDNNRFKQVNLIKSFKILHSEEDSINKKSIMVKLREIDNDFFKKEALSRGTNGIKYFTINSASN